MAVNARGPFLMCREVVPVMAHNGGAASSTSPWWASRGMSIRRPTLLETRPDGMTKVLAQEVQAQGIRVHALCPGGWTTWRPRRGRSGHLRADDPGGFAEITLLLIKQKGNALIDQINVRRASSAPWFS